MESTATNPTVLAKLVGFYTIEIRNIESGTVQAKADLLVMENLFFDKKIVKTFDLKGIQGRKVKPTTLGNSSKPFFDGDWLEGTTVSRIRELLLTERRPTTDFDVITPPLETRPSGGHQKRLRVPIKIEHHGLLTIVGN